MSVKIGIDYGKVIDKYPLQFALLTRILSGFGCEIHIITGMNYGKFGDDCEDKLKYGDNVVERVRNFRSYELRMRGIVYDVLAPHDDRGHTNDDKGKGKYCRDVGIDIMFDDNDGYIQDIRRWSPGTKIVVVRGGGDRI